MIQIFGREKAEKEEREKGASEVLCCLVVWVAERRKIKGIKLVLTISPTTKIFVPKIKTHHRIGVDTIPSLPL